MRDRPINTRLAYLSEELNAATYAYDETASRTRLQKLAVRAEKGLLSHRAARFRAPGILYCSKHNASSSSKADMELQQSGGKCPEEECAFTGR